MDTNMGAIVIFTLIIQQYLCMFVVIYNFIAATKNIHTYISGELYITTSKVYVIQHDLEIPAFLIGIRTQQENRVSNNVVNLALSIHLPY